MQQQQRNGPQALLRENKLSGRTIALSTVLSARVDGGSNNFRQRQCEKGKDILKCGFKLMRKAVLCWTRPTCSDQIARGAGGLILSHKLHE